MRSLFARILLWTLAAVALTVAGFIVTTSMGITATRGRQNVFARMVAVQVSEARHAYETGGRPGLASFLNRYRETTDTIAFLTDARGVDLITGRDHSRLIERAEERAPFPLIGRRRSMIFARASEDGRYTFVTIVPRSRAGLWFLLPQYLWVLGAIVLLSYALAWHLTRPVRQLETAVERFGKGDLAARVNSRRRDELGQLGQAFDQMAERIQALLSSQRRLLMDISHELRSPLARLRVAAELARSGEDREAALNRIEKEVDRLNLLISELLEVTRAEADPAVRRCEPVRLDSVVTAVAEDSALEAQARKCRVELAPPPQITVEGDPELLRRAVENTVRNAVRHAPAGSAVEIAMRQTGSAASVHVRDYGPGVPEEALERIFEPFYRVESDRNRSSGGVGLGLAIARRAVELHHGAIRAKNAHPGLAVEIELPVPPAARG